MSLESDISDVLAHYWLEENLYCGMSSTEVFRRLSQKLSKPVTINDVRKVLGDMQAKGLVSTRQVQGEIYAYPKRPLLEPRDPLSKEDVGIYTKQLRLGGSQIEHRFFRRQVLDRYNQDPRYVVGDFGSSGSIFIKDEFYDDKDTLEADKVSIQTFGIGYRENGERIVAVILSDLGRLSKEHQQYWASFEIHEKCFLDSDYVKTSFGAEFTDRVSPFIAFIQELREINRICDLIGEPHLFRKTYEKGHPQGFDWITKPTALEFYSFAHVTDKLISENLNKKFFKGKVELKERIVSDEGEVPVEKGTLRLLDEYLTNYVRFPDPEPRKNMIATFKKIRELRQKPAHTPIEDDFDPSYFKRQRDLIYEAYGAVRILRLIFMNHPLAKSYKPPKWVHEGKIV